MITLALDLATNCGWALLRADGRIESGCERFEPKRKEGPGARWVRFRRWLVELKEDSADLKKVAYEEVTFIGGPGAAYAVQIYGGFVAILQAFCEHHGLEYEGYAVGTIKKAWTGNGAAKKDQMVARCKELGFRPKDDNEADAIALLHLATGRVPRLTDERLLRQARGPRRKNADTRSRKLDLLPAEPF